MRCEILEVKRCCFCVPLRYGLIAWAYFRLLFGIIAMFYFMMVLKALIELLILLEDKSLLAGNIAIVVVLVTLVMVDNVLCIVFLVSAHKKVHKVMKAYYIYLLVILGITSALFLLFFVLRILNYSKLAGHSNIGFKIAIQTIAEFINIVSQMYFIILLRSEIRKLSGNSQFRFSNNATDAECNMVVTTIHEQPGDVPSKNKETFEVDQSLHINEKPLYPEQSNYPLN